MSARAEFDELMRPKGRRSAHPDDDDDRSFLHLSDDDDDEPEPSAAPPPRPSTNLSRSNIPTTRYDANTGPKGVIADAQNFRDSQRQHRSSLRTSSALSRAQQGGYSNSNSNSNGYGYGYNSGGHVGRQSPGTFSTSEKLSEAAEDADGLDDDDDELDDEGADDGEFMHKWRMTRLQELQMGGTAAAASKAHSRERGGSRRLWGGLATVDGGGFLDAVDRCPPGTVVVVYIYDDYVRMPRDPRAHKEQNRARSGPSLPHDEPYES